MAAAFAPASGPAGLGAEDSAASAATGGMPLLEAAASATADIDLSATVPVEAADGKSIDAPIEALKLWGFTKELLDGGSCFRACQAGRGARRLLWSRIPVCRAVGAARSGSGGWRSTSPT